MSFTWVLSDGARTSHKLANRSTHSKALEEMDEQHQQAVQDATLNTSASLSSEAEDQRQLALKQFEETLATHRDELERERQSSAAETVRLQETHAAQTAELQKVCEQLKKDLVSSQGKHFCGGLAPGSLNTKAYCRHTQV